LTVGDDKKLKIEVSANAETPAAHGGRCTPTIWIIRTGGASISMPSSIDA